MNLRQCLVNFDVKTKFWECWRRADTITQVKLQQLRTLTRAWITELYTNSQGLFDWARHIRSLKYCTGENEAGGIYVLVIRSGSGHLLFKFGMSFHCYKRAREQSGKFAARYMDLNQLENLVPVELVERIREMELPGLVFHPDFVEHAKHLIRMQLVESVLGCSASNAECVANTVAERLLQQPCPEVREAVQPHPDLWTPEVVAFFQNIGTGKVQFLFSWRTLSAALWASSNPSEFLRRRLRLLPGFVKEFVAKALVGDKYKGFIDCINDSPREDTLDEIVHILLPILTAIPEGPIMDESVCQEIQGVLDGIRGVNYDDYVRPSQVTVGRGAREKLPGLLESTEEDGMTVMERHTWVGLLMYDRPWAEATIDIPNGVEVMPEFPGALTLFRTRKTNRRLVIMASHFIIFAENVTPLHRRRAVLFFLLFLDVLQASGNVDPEHVASQRALLQSFLMGADGLSNGTFSTPDYAARSA